MFAPNQKHQKKGWDTIDQLFADAENVWVIHYSCESFYDRTDSRSPRITSLAVRKLDGIAKFGMLEVYKPLLGLRVIRHKHSDCSNPNLIALRHSHSLFTKLQSVRMHFYGNTLLMIVAALAKKIKLNEAAIVFSKSFASRRWLPIHANVRSTTQRYGKIAHFFGSIFSEMITFFPIARASSSNVFR